MIEHSKEHLINYLLTTYENLAEYESKYENAEIVEFKYRDIYYYLNKKDIEIIEHLLTILQNY